MVLFGRTHSRLVCFLSSEECAECDRAAVNLDLGVKLPCSWFSVHTSEPSLARSFPGVLHILAFGSFAKIIPSVIGLYSIAMLALSGWPSANHVEKSKPMLHIERLINSDVPVAVAFDCSGTASDRAPTSGYFPRPDSCIWSVMKNFFKVILVHKVNIPQYASGHEE